VHAWSTGLRTRALCVQAARLLRDIGRHVEELSTEVQGCAAVVRAWRAGAPHAARAEGDSERKRAQVREFFRAVVRAQRPAALHVVRAEGDGERG